MGIIQWIINIWNPPAPTPPTPVPTPIDVIAGLLAEHNRYRAANDMPPLAIDPLLTKAAQNHAMWMSQHGMRHTGFPGWISDTGYKYSACGENIAWNYHTPVACTKAWMSDRGHKANVLGNYQHVGFGVVNDYWCADYASPSQHQLDLRWRQETSIVVDNNALTNTHTSSMRMYNPLDEERSD